MDFILKHQADTTANLEVLTERVDSFVIEMRGAMNNLIIANEVTRDLAEKTAKLALQTSKRVTKIQKSKGK